MKGRAQEQFFQLHDSRTLSSVVLKRRFLKNGLLVCGTATAFYWDIFFLCPHCPGLLNLDSTSRSFSHERIYFLREVQFVCFIYKDSYSSIMNLNHFPGILCSAMNEISQTYPPSLGAALDWLVLSSEDLLAI